MDAFKRATLLTVQAAAGHITADEVRVEMVTLLPLMQADPESQLPKPRPATDKPKDAPPKPAHEEPKHA